ncbi:hypothetical protein AFCDBAGC_0323 [Methylobacterium cerastii]|uniref:Uncharacterized protein n=2 Tax=Methylobacterium TaxID=407 RepID=A0ABQ4QCD3_9HYPH|nr:MULTISPECIES: hypothetical protein [Methylobacterium]GJD42485.1 hypothetical protein AFCDBAGC_0323 [Methylobacterium cerastii]
MTDAPKTATGQDFIPAATTHVETARVEAKPAIPGASVATPIAANQLFDQLARIEDKTSRIEDKYARSESLLTRVEDKVEGASNRMNEAARQSDLAALRSEMRGLTERTRRLPGTGALVLTAIITAVLTVVLMVAVQRLNLDSLLPPRANATAPAAQAPATSSAPSPAR